MNYNIQMPLNNNHNNNIVWIINAKIIEVRLIENIHRCAPMYINYTKAYYRECVDNQKY